MMDVEPQPPDLVERLHAEIDHLKDVIDGLRDKLEQAQSDLNEEHESKKHFRW